MAIPHLTEEEFRAIMRDFLTPARAISDPAYLRGRGQLLEQIAWAFNSPGKNVFIFGARGVGKTSLAQTAAVLHQSADSEPIQIACDEFVDFNQMIADIARAALPPREVIERRTKETTAGLKLPLIGAETKEGLAKGVIPPVGSLNEAVVLLKYIASFHSKEPVVIIDEFDQVSNAFDKKRFADLIKQVSDQSVNIKFIFCGIGASLEELIGVHLSTDRYLAPIEVPPLTHDSLWEILDSTAKALGLEVGHEEKVRISTISDGYPYYVHLIGEHMFRAMFYDAREVRKVQLPHFDEGVRGAVSESLGSLKRAYQLAVQKRVDDYEAVLWSVADDTMLERKTAEIYDKSYLPLMQTMNSGLPDDQRKEVLDQQRFYQRMNSLKRDAHGCILTANKQGWYRFTENWMRGYVRLMAEKSGVHLGIDHHFAPKPEHRI